MTPEEHKALQVKHLACASVNTTRLPQRTAAAKDQGRCHMPGTQCAHIQEYTCTQCGLGWAEEAPFQWRAYA